MIHCNDEEQSRAGRCFRGQPGRRARPSEALIMASDAKPETAKITYATMAADHMEELHRKLDAAIANVRSGFGATHQMFINGREVVGSGVSDDTSPIDTRILIGRFQEGTPQRVSDAVAAAQAAYPAWSGKPWEQRVRLVRAIGERIHARRVELAALLGFEGGKSRLEALGEIEESADFFTYYSNVIEETDCFRNVMGIPGSPEDSISVLRPYGVWAVISPFNFPLALAAGPTAGALLAGNTIVFKPATDTPLLGLKLYELVAETLPPGVFNFVTGGGSTVGQPLVDDPGVSGVVFTGSMQVGLHLMRANAARPIPRPIIVEMGGKNPAIVTASADLDKASDGVMRSAFGNQGQKCSACSRVYVDRSMHDRFLELLVEKTKKIRIGNPLERDVWMGPVINERAVKTYEEAVARAKADGGKILTGGRRLMDEPFNHGYFVEPAVVTGLPTTHPMYSRELFVPIVVVGSTTSLDEALTLANRTEYGLTAGIFSEDEAEIEQFFDRIEAGVTYANRRAGATTGAWPGINSFGGWKASGSTGKGTGGPHYLQQFFREQSRVRVT
jgi:1-pyrroline-5-carboxylate dehydrogenase